MSSTRSRRAVALLCTGALGAGAAVAASPAQAGLLDGLGTIVTQTGATLNTLLPGTGGVVTTATGVVGGVVDGVQGTLGGVVDETLAGLLSGDGSGALPTDTVDGLLGTLFANSSAAPGTPGLGGPTAGGPIVLSGGGAVVDASAPRTTVAVLSKLKQVGRTGKLRIEIRTNEPGVVAVVSRIRPGKAVKARKGAPRVTVSRKLIKIPPITLGYRQAGKLVVTVRLSRAAQRALGHARDARMSVGTVAVDVYRNQDSDNSRLKLKR